MKNIISDNEYFKTKLKFELITGKNSLEILETIKTQEDEINNLQFTKKELIDIKRT